MSDLTMKAGDTLLADCTYRDALGQPVDLAAAGITIESAVMMKDGIERFPLEVTMSDQATQPGQYRIRGDSAGWTVGKVLWDVRYKRGADSFASRTISITLIPRIT